MNLLLDQGRGGFEGGTTNANYVNLTLLRLKELETLEKVTEKVDQLTVFGGLDGALKDVVRIEVPAN